MSFKPFRIAIRDEGDSINAYFAKTETMEGAMLVASFKRSVFEADARLFEAFQLFMQMVGVSMVEQATGKTVEAVDIEQAPEHERAGRA